MSTTLCALISAVYVMIFVTCTELAMGSECNSSIVDNNRYYYDQPLNSYPQDGYCFVNEFTIKIKESKVLLCVINNTDDRLIATNTTHLFSFVGHDMSYCSSDASTGSYQISTALYTIRIIVWSLSIIVAIAVISLHLMFKKLCTIPGILVIILCITFTFLVIVDVIWIALFDYHKIIEITAESCVTITYLGLIGTTSYEVTKTAILIHFVYIMYRCYKLLGNQENERPLLRKYIIFIVGVSAFVIIIVIAIDLTANKRDFITSNGECVYFFANSTVSFSVYNISLVAFGIIYLLTQVTLVVIGLLFYFLTTRQCCSTSSGSSKHFRIFIILVFTIEFNSIITVIFLGLRVNVDVLFTTYIAVSGIHQAILFVLFASSSKVTCYCMKGGKLFTTS